MVSGGIWPRLTAYPGSRGGRISIRSFLGRRSTPGVSSGLLSEVESVRRLPTPGCSTHEERLSVSGRPVKGGPGAAGAEERVANYSSRSDRAIKTHGACGSQAFLVRVFSPPDIPAPASLVPQRNPAGRLTHTCMAYGLRSHAIGGGARGRVLPSLACHLRRGFPPRLSVSPRRSGSAARSACFSMEGGAHAPGSPRARAPPAGAARRRAPGLRLSAASG